MESLYGTNFMCAKDYHHSSSGGGSTYCSSDSNISDEDRSSEDRSSLDGTSLGDNCSNINSKGSNAYGGRPNLASPFLNWTATMSHQSDVLNDAESQNEVDYWQNKFQNKLHIGKDVKFQNEDALESTVYMKKDATTYYKLTFVAHNVVFVPLFLKQRMFQETLNDKIIQTKSEFFYDYRVNYKVYFPLNYANYRLLSDDSETYTPRKQIPQQHKRSKAREKYKSTVFIRKGSILFNLSTSFMNIDLIRPVTWQDECQNLINKNSDLKDYLKNRGSIILRVKDDLIQVNFDMTNVFFERHIPTISKGTQFESDVVYYKEFSNVVRRYLYIPVPLSTYNYHNPIPKKLYENMTNALNGIDPVWMPEIRRKRISANRIPRNYEAKKEQTEQKNQNSIVVFQSESKLFRCVHGIFTGTIDKGALEYENTIIDYYRRKAIAKRKYGTEDKTMEDRTVPDWNFNIHFG